VPVGVQLGNAMKKSGGTYVRFWRAISTIQVWALCLAQRPASDASVVAQEKQERREGTRKRLAMGCNPGRRGIRIPISYQYYQLPQRSGAFVERLGIATERTDLVVPQKV